MWVGFVASIHHLFFTRTMSQNHKILLKSAQSKISRWNSLKPKISVPESDGVQWSLQDCRNINNSFTQISIHTASNLSCIAMERAPSKPYYCLTQQYTVGQNTQPPIYHLKGCTFARWVEYTHPSSSNLFSLAVKPDQQAAPCCIFGPNFHQNSMYVQFAHSHFSWRIFGPNFRQNNLSVIKH